MEAAAVEVELFFLTKTITMPTRSEHQSLNLEIAELRQRAHHVEWELVTHSAAPERRVITGDKAIFAPFPAITGSSTHQGLLVSSFTRLPRSQ
jgi:hypothetical protein